MALTLQRAGYTNVSVLQGPFALNNWVSAGGPVEP